MGTVDSIVDFFRHFTDYFSIGGFLLRRYRKIAADGRIDPEEITLALVDFLKVLEVDDEKANKIIGIVQTMVQDEAFKRIIDYLEEILGCFGMDMSIKVDPVAKIDGEEPKAVAGNRVPPKPNWDVA
jgi:hypothetical protein